MEIGGGYPFCQDLGVREKLHIQVPAGKLLLSTSLISRLELSSNLTCRISGEYPERTAGVFARR